MKQSVSSIRVDRSSAVFSLVEKTSALIIFRGFSTTKVTPCWGLNLTTFMQKYTTSRVIFYSITVFYLQYHRNGKLKARMSSNVNWIHPACNRIGRKLSSKTKQFATFYSITSTSLIQLQNKAWLIEHGFIFQERQKLSSLPFRVTNEVKLSLFQYK